MIFLNKIKYKYIPAYARSCFYCCLIVVITNTLTLAVNGQENQPDRLIHTKKYFMVMEQARFLEIVNKDSISLNTELAIVSRLLSKNDSLLKDGNIYDSVSAGIAKRLSENRTRIDSLLAKLKGLKIYMNPLSSFQNRYNSLVPAINDFDSRLQNNKPLYENEYRKIEQILDVSNLSKEKGRLKGILNNAAAQQAKEAEKIGEIGNKKDSLLNSGNFDATIAGKIDIRLQAYKRRMDSLNSEIKTLEQNLNSPKVFTKDFVLIKAKIILIDSVVNKSASSREYIFSMIDEGLSKATGNLFGLAAFFGPGGYTIPESKYPQAQKYFSPVIDSLIKFSNNYATVLRSASIVVNGFADGTQIAVGSPLYKILATYLNNPQPSKQELNAALSALRAEQISKFLNRVLKERFPDFKNFQKVVFESIEIGQGEKLPEPSIKDYKLNDERRRVVIIFWNILPLE